MTALSIGGVAANPLLVAAPIAGLVAKSAADAGTKKKVATLRANVARGNGASLGPVIGPKELKVGAALSLGAAANENEERRGAALEDLRKRAPK